ncbi:tetratricopeptide repeat protein [Actinacidiphila glaucinigra]|uniref:tetratricopeptide repeat protein n=1 Tax=Actinacidiphila glaucinigra TaxID=235986 RepID=UPI0035D8323B
MTAGRAPHDAKHAARQLLDLGVDAAGRGDAHERVEDVKAKLVPLARQGDAQAQTLLGAIELELQGNPRGAHPWFEMAAAQNDPAGQRGLGHLYATGLGVPADRDRAVELFTQAAAAGDAYAMYNLASANIQAEGQYLSFDATVTHLRAAANRGIPAAWARLGDLFSADDQDAEALECYVKAAEAGHTGAMNAAACWYRDGTAGQVDLVQATRWFLTMLRYGNGDGIHEIFQFASRMSPEQIRQAARLAGDPAAAESFISVLEGRGPRADT